MSAIAQPALSGMTAQAASDRVHITSGASRNMPLLAGRRDHRLLQHELEQVGEGLEQAPGADHVRAAAQLHRRPDLAVGIERVGDEDEEGDEHEQALAQHDRDREEDVSEIHDPFLLLRRFELQRRGRARSTRP